MLTTEQLSALHPNARQCYEHATALRFRATRMDEAALKLGDPLSGDLAKIGGDADKWLPWLQGNELRLLALYTSLGAFIRIGGQNTIPIYFGKAGRRTKKNAAEHDAMDAAAEELRKGAPIQSVMTHEALRITLVRLGHARWLNTQPKEG